MSQKSKIEWTESTWNPVTGCSKVSDGCLNCYAERMAKRLKAMGNPRYVNEFKVTLHHDIIERPLEWKNPKMIFVNSMSDLFHEDIPFNFIEKVFTTMNKAKQHTFQVLTKRSSRLLELSSKLNWTDNIWLGVSVENQDNVYRIDNLIKTPAKIKFVSFEPLISKISKVNLNKVDWAIVGGESGPGARPMEKEWVIFLRDECLRQNVKFFFKQWGGVQKHKNGRLLEGRKWSEYPILQNASDS